MDIITYGLLKKKIRELEKMIENLGKYLGQTDTQLSDGDSTNPIEINGEMITAKSGDLTVYGPKEFIFDGKVWKEAGDLSALGLMAYSDSASAFYTPCGDVSQPTFNGTSATLQDIIIPQGHLTNVDIIVLKDSVRGMAGTGTLPSHTYNNGTLTLNPGTLPTMGESKSFATDIDTITQPTFVGDDTTVEIPYTPAGTVTKPSFTGTRDTITVTPDE